MRYKRYQKAHYDYIAKMDPCTKEIITLYESFLELEQDGYDKGAVCNCCRNYRRTHQSFAWKYFTKETLFEKCLNQYRPQTDTPNEKTAQ